VITRAATEDDLPAILQIQESALDAAQWDPRDYLAYECLVAENGAAIVGFLVARAAGPESEILNLAVAPGFRRQGIGRQLLSDFGTRHPGDLFLEVRESNEAARRFYERLGFAVVIKRLRYYDNPPDSAIVMKLHS
jgi:ribosomal-protein-alanine N-acetyltransferase